MKRYIAILLIVGMLPLVSMAQDDMYFVPSKKKATKAEYTQKQPQTTYYSGSQRDVDEYNRQGGYTLHIDSAGNTTLSFDGATDEYPPSDYVATEDYSYTKRMSRFDDYAWDAGYRRGYHDAFTDSWYWNDPWYYDRWYYASWRYGGWSFSWHHPIYWHRPHYWHHPWYGGSWYRPYRGVTGTRNRGSFRNNRSGSFTNTQTGNRVNSNSNRGTFRSNRGTFNSNRNGSFNTNSSSSRSNNSSFNSNRSGSFNNRSSSGSFGSSRSSGGGSRSGGNFGGRR